MSDELQIEAPSWGSYPKIYALGHSAVRDIFKDDVIVEEKIDGSQFSFGVFNGELRCRSKSVNIDLLAPQKMFVPGIAVAQYFHEKGVLNEGWTYRGEFLGRPKHNTLAYDRIPMSHIIGFDINTAKETYLSYEAKKAEFERLGLECVPIVHRGPMEDMEQFRELLTRESVLGGVKVEGVVVKNYARYTPDGRAMMGKFVSEAFKEAHHGDWKDRNPNRKDVLETIIQEYQCSARWDKAIQHLRDAGELEESPRDIGKLVREVPNDIRGECEEEIKEKLFKWAWPQISRGVIRGLPQFYKERLAEQSFE